MSKQHLFFMLCMLLLLIPIHAQDETTVFSEYEFAWTPSTPPDESVTAFERIIDMQPDWAESYFGHASKLRFEIRWNFSEGDELPVEELNIILHDIEAAEALLSEPDYELALLKADIYDALGDTEQAEANYLQLVDMQPYQSTAYSRLYWLYIKQERYEEAEAQFEQMLRVEPGRSILFSDIYRTYEQSYDEDHAAYNQLIADGFTHARDLDYEEALVEYQAAYDLARESDSLNIFREAYALYQIVDAQRWMQYLAEEGLYSQEQEIGIRTVIALAPDWDMAYVRMVYILLSSERPEAALELVNEALELMPTSPNLYERRAAVYDELGDDSAAGQNYYDYLRYARTHLTDWSAFDATLQATPIYSQADWQHRFRIQAETNQKLTVTLESDGTRNDWIIILLDEDENVVAYEYFYSPPYGSYSPLLEVTIPKNGDYTILVAELVRITGSLEKLVVELE